jgi:hypothetical protein
MVAALCLGALIALPGSFAMAQTAIARTPAGAAPSSDHRGLSVEEFSSQSRRVLGSAPRRVRIYNSRNPGPNSVRICNAHYEYEYRPSGTVIVPRMQCYWSG